MAAVDVTRTLRNIQTVSENNQILSQLTYKVAIKPKLDQFKMDQLTK